MIKLYHSGVEFSKQSRSISVDCTDNIWMVKKVWQGELSLGGALTVQDYDEATGKQRSKEQQYKPPEITDGSLNTRS